MKIAMSSIVKNERKFIANYLERNKDADYICLLDTGSNDGTWEYLQEKAITNPKLIIQQKIYEKFNFSEARNDSFLLIPNDTDIVVALDIDEYFTDDNWVEIVKNYIMVTGKREFYTTPYLDGSSYNLTDYPRLCITSRINQTKAFRWYHCIHEVISDDDWDHLGNRNSENVNWNNLFIVHQPDRSKDRQSYIDLCLERVEEILPLDYDIEFEKLMSRDLLMFEYYRNDMYDEAIEVYDNYLSENELTIFDASPCMYKMTNDIQYIRNAMDLLETHWYEQHLLYFALRDDFDYCRQYKDVILQKIFQHELQVEERFRQYDTLGNIIKDMAENL